MGRYKRLWTSLVRTLARSFGIVASTDVTEMEKEMNVKTKTKKLMVVEGHGLDEAYIIRQRPLIESYVMESLGVDNCHTEMMWWLNEDEETFNFEIHFYEAR